LCGHIETAWKCGRCKSTQLRAVQIGAQRTAEELGRAFPGTAVRSSSGDHIVRTIPPTPSIVVATPGAVPVVEGGYEAAIIIDGNAQISRTALRAGEDAFHKWMEVVGQVRAGGEVVIVADSENPIVQAVIRHDPIGFAQRENEQRAEVQLPPAVRLIALTGTSQDVDDFLTALDFKGLVRGPVPIGDNVRYLLTCPRQESQEVIAQVKAVTAARSAKKKGGVVNVRIDPRDI
jgi:primosomal protein N' (replication factor Y)